MTERERTDLRPGETLIRSPLFWFALFALALNDHVLKGSGLAPAWLTGKLSDFAGLYVAPILLAAVLRVRSYRAWLACQLATGGVFATIKLSEPCAALWVALAKKASLHFVVISDASDLIALPMLALAFYMGSRQPHEQPAPWLIRRPFLERSALALGLPLCVATSDVGGASEFSSYGPHVHNPSSAPLILGLRTLRSSVQMDCATIGGDPGSLLPSSAFGPATLYRLEAHENLPMPQEVTTTGAPCSAVLINGEGLEPAIVFWSSETSFGPVPAKYDSGDTYETGAIIVERDGDGMFKRYTDVGDFVFAIEAPPLAAERCAQPSEEQHTDIKPPINEGSYHIDTLDDGPDGCVALSLTPVTTAPIDSEETDAGTSGGELDDPPPRTTTPGAERHYVCVPPGAFPFAKGQTVRAAYDSSSAYVLRNATGPEELVIYRGAGGAVNARLRAEIQVDPRCELGVQSDCAVVYRSERVVLSGATSATLRPGESTPWPGASGASTQVTLLSAGQRALFDRACDVPDASLLRVLELVVTTRKEL